jgi:hypothetical protein
LDRQQRQPNRTISVSDKDPVMSRPLHWFARNWFARNWAELRLTALRMTALVGLTLVLLVTAHAQITAPRSLSATIDRYATLEEQLTNRLRATRQDQIDYVKFVVKQVRAGKLDTKLVVAIERYALRRNPHYPFLYFERALRFEANKRGVPLPTVKQFASTKTGR